MANQAIFAPAMPGPTVTTKTTTNDAGGVAYARDAESALAQLAVTGTFNDTYYASAMLQLERTAALAEQVSTEYLAKLAIYAAEKGRMKDMPAFLLAILSRRNPALFRRVFNRVITNGKMLRNFVQFIRSGAGGRKSLGSGPKNAIARWLNESTLNRLMYANVGNAPSLKDVIRLAHPKAIDKQHEEFFSYCVRDTEPTFQPLIDYKNFVAQLAEYNTAIKEGLPALPPVLPAVPLEMLMALDMPTSLWFTLAMQMTWTQLRMNLNTLQRNGVLEADLSTAMIASRLRDPVEIRKSGCMPYQIFTTYLHGKDLPQPIQAALESAMETACENVPAIETDVVFMLDISGSMQQAVTGNRKGSTSVMTNVQVAALIASALMRKATNPLLIPFDTRAYKVDMTGENAAIAPHYPIMHNAKTMAGNGGATDVSIPLRAMNDPSNHFQLSEDAVLVMLSDNESWARAAQGYYGGTRTAMIEQWRYFRRTHPKAKLICVDISPNTTSQVPDEPGVINIGGFSDAIFTIIDDFVHERNDLATMAQRIHAVNMEA